MKNYKTSDVLIVFTIKNDGLREAFASKLKIPFNSTYADQSTYEWRIGSECKNVGDVKSLLNKYAADASKETESSYSSEDFIAFYVSGCFAGQDKNDKFKLCRYSVIGE